jgi:hypothetical protein
MSMAKVGKEGTSYSGFPSDLQESPDQESFQVRIREEWRLLSGRSHIPPSWKDCFRAACAVEPARNPGANKRGKGNDGGRGVR